MCYRPCFADNLCFSYSALGSTFQCVALAQLPAESDQDLALTPGDIIDVDDFYRENPGWWRGKNVATGLIGQFPSTYVAIKEHDEIDAGDINLPFVISLCFS